MTRKKRFQKRTINIDTRKVFVTLFLVVCYLYFLVGGLYKGIALSRYLQGDIITYEGKPHVEIIKRSKNTRLKIALDDGAVFKIPIELFSDAQFVKEENPAIFRYVKIEIGVFKYFELISVDSIDKTITSLTEQSSVKELRMGMIVFSVFGGGILCLIIPLCLPLSVHILIWKWWKKQMKKYEKGSRM